MVNSNAGKIWRKLKSGRKFGSFFCFFFYAKCTAVRRCSQLICTELLGGKEEKQGKTDKKCQFLTEIDLELDKDMDTQDEMEV